MLLFPFRAQIKLHKWPVMTIAVAVVCLLIYAAQSQSDRRVEAQAERVCAEFAAGGEGAARDYQFGRWTIPCKDVLRHIHYDPRPEQHLQWHLDDLARNGDPATAERLRAQYRAFAERAPVPLTARLWHDRSRFDPVGMITSSFAHGDWEHVIFNLIFFFAFAAAVELILGPVLFLGMIVALSLGIGVFDHIVAHWEGDPMPSLGLSGVVMGMLALFVYFLPRAKIRFFFWFMLSFGAIGIPAWVVALWYIGWDYIYLLNQIGGSTNFIAHISGAAFGYLLGIFLFRAKRHWARELVEERVDLTQNESTLRWLNGLMVGPAVAGFAFLAGTLLILIVITLIQSFWLQLLLAAPPAAAGYYLYRSRRSERPTRDVYRLGLEALARHEYDQAIKHLAPLAQANDTRALFALGRLYAGAPGALRNEPEALQLYTRAAERDHAEAQYALGSFYADGRGVAANPLKAAEWYEKAATRGMPEAANSLGRLYENGIGVSEDREKSIEWYYRAAVAFKKAGRREDAEAIIRHLDGLARQYPAVLGLVTRLRQTLALAKE
ncbi:MAG: rhomboid family intramembrane serine protease [Sulfuricaulis sp.]